VKSRTVRTSPHHRHAAAATSARVTRFHVVPATPPFWRKTAVNGRHQPVRAGSSSSAAMAPFHVACTTSPTTARPVRTAADHGTVRAARADRGSTSVAAARSMGSMSTAVTTDEAISATRASPLSNTVRTGLRDGTPLLGSDQADVVRTAFDRLVPWR
jgi:hypothetical protein